MSLDPSHAVVDRILRDIVDAYRPDMPPDSHGVGVDRSLRRWLRRVVLPRLIRSVVLIILPVVMVRAFFLEFAHEPRCEELVHIPEVNPCAPSPGER